MSQYVHFIDYCQIKISYNILPKKIFGANNVKFCRQEIQSKIIKKISCTSQTDTASPLMPLVK